MTIEQIKTAIQSGKKTVSLNGKTIKLPEPQTAGTRYQNESYAYMNAQRIYNAR